MIPLTSSLGSKWYFAASLTWQADKMKLVCQHGWYIVLQREHKILHQIPYSRKLLREKTFANWWKIWFLQRKLLWIARFCHTKGQHAQKLYSYVQACIDLLLTRKIMSWLAICWWSSINSSPSLLSNLCSWAQPGAVEHSSTWQLFCLPWLGSQKVWSCQLWGASVCGLSFQQVGCDS